MKVKGDIILIDEPTCVADTASLIAEWVQQQFGSLEASLPRGYAKDKLSTIERIWQVRIDPDRRRDPASVDNIVGLIRNFWRSIRMRFSRSRRLKQRVERYLDGHDGRRLPLPQAIRRSNRMAHEAQTTSGDSGGDDD